MHISRSSAVLETLLLGAGRWRPSSVVATATIALAGLTLAACESAADLQDPLSTEEIDALIAQLADHATPRSHGSRSTPGSTRATRSAYRGGDLIPSYTLDLGSAAPDAHDIRAAVFDLDRDLEHWALEAGWPMSNCRVDSDIAVDFVSHAVLTSRTGNARIIGQYSSPPERIQVAFDTGSWRSTLAHELAHAAYARCGWGSHTRKDSEAFAQAFEVWVARDADIDLPICRGLFKRRRARRGLCF